MRARAFGRVLSVRERHAGGLLAVDAAATDTELVLDDVTQFGEVGTAAILSNEDGDTEDITITAYDPDTDTLTLDGPLAADWFEGDRVTIDPAIVTRIAMVAVDGAEDEAVEVLVPSQVAHLLSVGSRLDVSQERVTIEYEFETSSWTVRDVWVTNAFGVELDVTDGTTTVSPVLRIVFDAAEFVVTDAGDGVAEISLAGS